MVLFPEAENGDDILAAFVPSTKRVLQLYGRRCLANFVDLSNILITFPPNLFSFIWRLHARLEVIPSLVNKTRANSNPAHPLSKNSIVFRYIGSPNADVKKDGVMPLMGAPILAAALGLSGLATPFKNHEGFETPNGAIGVHADVENVCSLIGSFLHPSPHARSFFCCLRSSLPGWPLQVLAATL